MDPAFEVHTLNDEGKKKAQQLAEMFDGLLSSVKNIAGPFDPNKPMNPDVARELAIVRTKLEEACFFSKKALASNPANQQ